MTLAALVADLGHPRVVFSEYLTIEGAAEWSRVLDHSPPPTPPEERRLFELLLAHAGLKVHDPDGSLPAWLCPELIPTKAARDRLRAWIEAGSVAPTADNLLRTCRYLGDCEIRSCVLKALHERIAPPVVQFLLDNVSFFGTGWSTRGYAITTATPPGAILRVILLDGAARDADVLLDTVLHEGAHHWTLPESVTPIRSEDFFSETAAALLAAARRPDAMREWLLEEARLEKAADDLARTWGGRLTCSDVRANAYTKARARQLDETYGGKA